MGKVLISEHWAASGEGPPLSSVKPVVAEGRKRASPLEARVALGRYIGTASRNADLLVMTPTGVVKGHSLHRRAEIDRWSTEGFSALRGLPWKMSNPVERAPPNRVDMPALVGEQPNNEEKDFKPRHLYVLKSDIAKFGYTPCCPGCIAQTEGSAARSHNEEWVVRGQCVVRECVVTMRRQGGRGHRQCVVTIRRQRQRQTSDPSCGCPVYI